MNFLNDTRRNAVRIFPFAVPIFLLAAVVPFGGNNYWTLIGTRIAIYWILISGLNLMIGYAGQLAIGYIAVLTLGAYTASVLAAGTILPALPAAVAFIAAAIVGALAGVIIGLPALRLRTFYFAMTTLGFATIIDQIALAWQSVTGGGIGISGPSLPGPFSGTVPFFYICLIIAAICTWITANIGTGRFGRALIAIRDAEVAAEACGIKKTNLLLIIFVLAGALAGLSGGLFASLQSYITPDAFTLNLSILFFISVLIGGRGSILGPLIGTIILTILPEIAAPLADWAQFLYAALLLIIVLLFPSGIAGLFERLSHKSIDLQRTTQAKIQNLGSFEISKKSKNIMSLKDIDLAFGGVKALSGISLNFISGEVHGLIGPNGSGKTTTLNVISGYYQPQSGALELNGKSFIRAPAVERASMGIARTFQTPKIIGDLSVIENVMIGSSTQASSNVMDIMLSLPRAKREEGEIYDLAFNALAIVGLDNLANIKADRLKHPEQRFLEIARALVSRPKFLLLDEPAAGLSPGEISGLIDLIKALRTNGIGVLLVEHHADLIFEVSDRITVLNFGKVLTSGTPTEVRSHEEVLNVYLGQ